MQTRMTQEKFIPYIIKEKGENHQINKAVEELAELQVELMKYNNNPNRDSFPKILEELADVELMCEQLREIFGFARLQIEEAKQLKIDRYTLGK